MSKVSVFISSRNNYSLLEEFLERNKRDLDGYYFVNIDDFSDQSQVEIGKGICKKHNIPFINNNARGLQNATQTMIDHLKEEGIESEYVLWMTHDSHTITPDFIAKFDKVVSTGKLQDFGVVGFNILGPQCGVKKQSTISLSQCGMIGRAPLTKLPGRGGWYRTPDMKLSWEEWGGNRAIAVESPVDMTLAININMFNKHIEVSDQYHLFCAFDDICLQFLKNGVYNVTLPFLQVWHDQHIKEGKIPVKSASAAKNGDSKHFGDYGPHFVKWQATWGWERDNVRSTFPLDRYPNGLIREFYDHDYTQGPIRTFEL